MLQSPSSKAQWESGVRARPLVGWLSLVSRKGLMWAASIIMEPEAVVSERPVSAQVKE
jgi:hypothetical protein